MALRLDLPPRIRRHLHLAPPQAEPANPHPPFLHPAEKPREDQRAARPRHGRNRKCRRDGTRNRTHAGRLPEAAAGRDRTTTILQAPARPRGHRRGVMRRKRTDTMDEPGRRTATRIAPRPAGKVAGLSLGHRPHRPRGTARTNPRAAAVAHPLHPRIAPPGSPHAARHPPRVRTARNRIVEKPHAGADPRNHELAHAHPLAEQDPHLG